VVQAVKHMLCKHEASNPSSTKKNPKKQNKQTKKPILSRVVHTSDLSYVGGN
jgi:hypothetical protein